MAVFPPTEPDDAAAAAPTPRRGAARSRAGWLDEADDSPRDAAATDLSALSASLMQDLMRFERQGEQRELLEVLAACIRHTQAVAVRLAWGHHEMTMTVFPTDRLVHCPMPMDEFLAGDLGLVQVLSVQPASLRAPGDAEPARVGNPAMYTPLAPLLWAVSLAGSRGDLLPELAGLAAYRMAPGVSLSGLYVPAAMADCITRLRRKTCNLREIADWPGIGRERAARLLNALYLQSGLIVSRTHPAATNDSWSGYR